MDFFFIRTRRRFVRIDHAALIYVESHRGYLKLVTETQNYMIIDRMLRLEAILPPEKFCRIHRGTIVALARVQSFDRHEVVMQEKGELKHFPIGQEKYREAFFSRLVVAGEVSARRLPVELGDE